jgi:hypothetical protein
MMVQMAAVTQSGATTTTETKEAKQLPLIFVTVWHAPSFLLLTHCSSHIRYTA